MDPFYLIAILKIFVRPKRFTASRYWLDAVALYAAMKIIPNRLSDYFIGIPGLILCYWCSYRVTVIVGGLLAVVGFAASYLQNELYHVYLSVGIIAGN